MKKLLKSYTRREAIEDCVATYIKNNPDEYQLFLRGIQKRKATMIDSKFGRLRNGMKVDDDDIRVAFSLPEKLYNAMDTILRGDDFGTFGEKQGEMNWFAKRFPQFLLPDYY